MFVVYAAANTCKLQVHTFYVFAAVTGILLTTVERNTQPGLWHVCGG